MHSLLNNDLFFVFISIVHLGTLILTISTILHFPSKTVSVTSLCTNDCTVRLSTIWCESNIRKHLTLNKFLRNNFGQRVISAIWKYFPFKVQYEYTRTENQYGTSQNQSYRQKFWNRKLYIRKGILMREIVFIIGKMPLLEKIKNVEKEEMKKSSLLAFLCEIFLWIFQKVEKMFF